MAATHAVVTAATLCRASRAQNPMSLLPILEFPHPRLGNVAGAVEAEHIADPAFQRLLDDMFQTMYEAPGIGLAAPQVDTLQRFMVLDVTEEKTRPLVFINPVIRSRSEELRVHQEGCLSIPGIYADVTRADGIEVEALDREGKPFVLRADGLLATCIQHEVDHLEGKLFIDYLSPLKREMALRKLTKLRKRA
jgi:peptide deformylase